MDLGIDIFGNPITTQLQQSSGTTATVTRQNGELVMAIDFANIFFRSFYMTLAIGQNIGDYTREEDLQAFGYKLTMDIISIYNIFKPRHLVLAIDGKDAWRKAILPDEYKAQRVKDEHIDWESLYKVSDDIQQILHKKLGAIVATCEHAEGDDIMCLIKECLWNKPEAANLIIISADADLRQLISFNKETSQYCIVYNPTTRPKTKTRRLYMNQEFKEWIEDDTIDIFFSNFNPVKNYLIEVLKKNTQIEPFVEDPNDVILSKIFCGDDSDQVPSFYSYYRSGKASRVTPAKYKKIIEMLHITDVHSLCENASNLGKAIEKVCKVRPDDIDIDERLMRQRRLVELNSELFPENIREYKDTLDYMLRNNIPRIDSSNVKTNEILEGTRYAEGNRKRTLEAEVFRDFDKLKKGGGVKATKIEPQPVVQDTPSLIDNEVLQEINTLF